MTTIKRQIGHRRSSNSVFSQLTLVTTTVYAVHFIIDHPVVAGIPPFTNQPTPECETSCIVQIANSSSGSLSFGRTRTERCSFVKDTFECERRTRNLTADYSRGTGSSNWTCPWTQVGVRLTPYNFDHPMYLPALSLNVSISVFDSATRAAAIRLICLQSGVEKEFYCENRTRPSHWDQFYWPCRLFDVSDIVAESLIYPFQFHHDCFRLSALSLFAINITLYPQNCTASFVFRMPSLANVLATAVTDWMPLVTVDANAEDGIWVYFSPPPSAMRVRRVVVEIFEILLPTGIDQHQLTNINQMKRVLRRRSTVTTPDTSSTFFVDLPAAMYSVVVYAEHWSCEDEKCLQMQVPFNLTKDHYTSYTKQEIGARKSLESAWIPATAITVAILVVFAAVIGYLGRKAAKRKRRQGTISFVRFDKRPIVLILYTNDFAHHRRCVMELATYLQNRANCEVEIDEWALSLSQHQHLYHHLTPDEWLMNALQRADYYVIVFSAGAKETAFRAPTDSGSFVELRSERPWDETFAPGINFILQKLLQSARSIHPSLAIRNGLMTTTGTTRRTTTNATAAATAAFYKIICITFSYSPAASSIPDLFQTLLPCPKFSLPDDLRRLLCHIHELPADTVHERSPLGADRLCAAITDTSAFIETNPDWLRSRLVEREVNDITSSGNEARPVDAFGERRQRIYDIAAAIERLRVPVLREVPENLDEFYSGIMEEQNRAYESSTIDDENGRRDEQEEAKYLLIPPSTAGEQEEQEPAASSQFELLPPEDEELASIFHNTITASNAHSVL